MKDDTISRQAAIAEVMCLCEECPVEFYINPCPSQQCDVRIMKKALENLPSAQSELENKIRAIGYTGKEGRIYIGGRLFAVRELPQ